MAIFVQQFNCVEQMGQSVTSTAGRVTFTSDEGIQALDLMVINLGTKGCQIRVGDSTVTAVNTASADHTRQYYIPPSTVIIVGKASSSSVSAICDGSDTTTLALHAGRGA